MPNRGNPIFTKLKGDENCILRVAQLIKKETAIIVLHVSYD